MQTRASGNSSMGHCHLLTSTSRHSCHAHEYGHFIMCVVPPSNRIIKFKMDFCRECRMKFVWRSTRPAEAKTPHTEHKDVRQYGAGTVLCIHIWPTWDRDTDMTEPTNGLQKHLDVNVAPSSSNIIGRRNFYMHFNVAHAQESTANFPFADDRHDYTTTRTTCAHGHITSSTRLVWLIWRSTRSNVEWNGKTGQNLNVGIWPKLILLLAHINCITFELARPGTQRTNLERMVRRMGWTGAGGGWYSTNMDS